MKNLKREIKKIKENEQFPNPREEKILKAIQKSKQAFLESEQSQTIYSFEFLFVQAKYIRKYWWVLQAVILLILWGFLYSTQSLSVMNRGFSIFAPIFAIILIPELWKNIRTQSTEIENVAYFTLRKVYASRLIIFGMTDLILLSLFLVITFMTIKIPIFDVLIQFLVPFNFSCCICFTILCSNRFKSEYLALSLCLIWSLIWYRVVINEELFLAITKVVWIGLLILSFLYMIFLIRKILKNCNNYCEVNLLWN